jgi:hypothetical protein
MEVLYPSSHEGEDAIQRSVSSEADLQSLIEALTQLAESHHAKAELNGLGATFDGLSGVTLIADANEHVLLQDGACEWTCTRANWDLGVTMLYALHRSGSGFQYMPPDSAGGLFVELWYQGPADPRAGSGRFRDDEPSRR